MPITSPIRVGHRDIVVEALVDPDVHVNNAYALYENFYSRIRVSTTREPADQAHLLVHELIHAAWSHYDIPARVTEEEAATKLSKALMAIARANPGLLTALEASLEGAPLLPQPAVAKTSSRRS